MKTQNNLTMYEIKQEDKIQVAGQFGISHENVIFYISGYPLNRIGVKNIESAILVSKQVEDTVVCTGALYGQNLGRVLTFKDHFEVIC